MEKETEDTIISMSKEFDEKQGYVTCEISIHKDLLPQFIAFIQDINICLGKWIVMECSTCVGYYGEGYLHARIERYDVLAKMMSASNYIPELNPHLIDMNIL